MNKTQAVVRVTEDQSENSAFALNQLIRWAARCYTLGAREMEAEDAIAAANIKRLVTEGRASIGARLDFSQGTCAFYLHLDDAGENAQELRLFTQAFAPEPLAH